MVGYVSGKLHRTLLEAGMVGIPVDSRFFPHILPGDLQRASRFCKVVNGQLNEENFISIENELMGIHSI